MSCQEEENSSKINILHAPPSACKPYALLPVGLYLNKEIREAKKGQRLEFWDDWRHEPRLLVRRCLVNTESSVMTFMVRSFYGEAMSAQKLLKQWQTECVRQGFGVKGMWLHVCLLVEVSPLIEPEILETLNKNKDK